MSERPTTVEEWDAAVRRAVENHRGLAAAYEAKMDEGGIPNEVDAWDLAYRVHLSTADGLAALLPPAKERVPWWEAKGRTVDGREITSVHDTRVGTTYFMGGRFGGEAGPDGRVEVDAR